MGDEALQCLETSVNIADSECEKVRCHQKIFTSVLRGSHSEGPASLYDRQ
jgi:hypothetical protein